MKEMKEVGAENDEIRKDEIRQRLTIAILEHFLLMKCPYCGQAIPDELIEKQANWIARRKEIDGQGSKELKHGS